MSMRTHAPTIFDVRGEIYLRRKPIEYLGMLGGENHVSTTRNDGENARIYLPSHLMLPTGHPEAPRPSGWSEAYTTSPGSMENPADTKSPHTNDAFDAPVKTAATHETRPTNRNKDGPDAGDARAHNNPIPQDLADGACEPLSS